MNNILIFGILSDLWDKTTTDEDGAITMATRHCRSNYRQYIPSCLLVG